MYVYLYIYVYRKSTIEQVTWTYMLAVLILTGFCIDLASAQVLTDTHTDTHTNTHTNTHKH